MGIRGSLSIVRCCPGCEVYNKGVISGFPTLFEVGISSVISLVVCCVGIIQLGSGCVVVYVVYLWEEENSRASYITILVTTQMTFYLFLFIKSKFLVISFNCAKIVISLLFYYIHCKLSCLGFLWSSFNESKLTSHKQKPERGWHLHVLMGREVFSCDLAL